MICVICNPPPPPNKHTHTHLAGKIPSGGLGRGKTPVRGRFYPLEGCSPLRSPPVSKAFLVSHPPCVRANARASKVLAMRSEPRRRAKLIESGRFEWMASAMSPAPSRRSPLTSAPQLRSTVADSRLPAIRWAGTMRSMRYHLLGRYDTIC